MEDAKTEIVGILLVKNEERFIHQILENIVDFCDKIIIADNLSEDNTSKLVSDFAERVGDKIEYHLISNPQISHDLIEKYAGSRTWIFGVDGDELYDPRGLSEIRAEILNGDFDDWWILQGNVLNCVELDLDEKIAKGYLAPPCRSMTKLYNFGLIHSWNGPCPERLHGGKVEFKERYSKSLRNEIYKQVPWQEAQLRCLHLCFIKRSKKDKADRQEKGIVIRKNISDMNSEKSIFNILPKVFRSFRNKDQNKMWKLEKYMRGELVTEDVSVFFDKAKGS